ncbi:MAG TPA: hypothetical protein PK736_05560 [Bacteroidia bacterium]|nr:hypothetical protein [Bacteroidia bacterium]
MKQQLLRILFLIAILFAANNAQAQFVTIPDPNFVTWLNNNGYAGCMNGNMMDTTCGAVVNDAIVDCSNKNISDLTGIEYFDSLKTLYCWNNQLTSLPTLPNTLTYLNCAGNQLTNLPTLPNSLTDLWCSNNQLTSLPTLPNSLIDLNCYYNQLTSLPGLPSTLTYLRCNSNQLTSLPGLPSTLTDLWCNDNQLTSLPVLPNSLTDLNCSINQLTSLPTLPSTLTYLKCYNNQLTNLPTLPSSLIVFQCYNNQLTSLPTLPSSLTDLNCHHNQLTSLPALPDSLYYLYCNNNPNLYCLPKLNTIVNFNFTNTGIQCIPNYGNVTNSNPLLSSLPLCDTGNTNGCVPYWNISGRVYQDTIANCSAEVNEPKYSLIKLNLYKNGLLEQTTYSNFDGNYAFNTDTGLFTITIDTVSKPFVVTCPMAFSDSALISGNDTMRYNKNFAIECKPGFDIGTTTIAQDSGIFRPANFANVKIFAGDISNHYGLHCSAGTSGSVQIIITGPATYISTVNGALTPIVNGDTLTYTIPDFGLVDFYNDFQIQLQTDTLAQLGDQVCFDVNVTPTIGDNNPANNTLTHCFTVVNSYDPNLKSVSPVNNLSINDKKLTYTIQFQNTGNAPAQHIYVMDTLDAALDVSTFELLAYSHQPQVQLIGNNLRFNFPNINLPDSTNDEPNSHGYVQFSIKLKDSLSIGTIIKNTSYIYFDFNPPVQTNTTSNVIISTGFNFPKHNSN